MVRIILPKTITFVKSESPGIAKPSAKGYVPKVRQDASLGQRSFPLIEMPLLFPHLFSEQAV
jgi:hypothetical protein